MLDMGFMPDIRRILDLLPNRKQTLLFSATFSDDIKRLAGSILTQPGDDRGRPPRHRRREPSASSSTRSTATARRSCSPT